MLNIIKEAKSRPCRECVVKRGPLKFEMSLEEVSIDTRMSMDILQTYELDAHFRVHYQVNPSMPSGEMHVHAQEQLNNELYGPIERELVRALWYVKNQDFNKAEQCIGGLLQEISFDR